MKSMIACLLVLAVAVSGQHQYFDYGYGGYFPYTGFRSAVYPNTFAPYYGYPSYSASQYHSQDELGQASFGYSHPGQAAANYRDGLGNQIGSYAYINPEGKEVRVSYTADHRGFRVLSNALPEAPTAVLTAPVQVQDTPEVAAAKAEFNAKYAAAKSGVAPAPVAAPVQDTPEVAAAKADFAVKFAAAKAAAAAPSIRRKRQVFSPYATPYGFAAPYGYAAPAQPVREAVLTRVINTPGHATSYRVD